MDATNRVEATKARGGAAEAGVDPRCPFLLYRDVLGPAYVADLLSYVAGRRADFQTGLMRNRETGEVVGDPVHRDAVYLTQLGELLGPIKSFVSAIAAPALRELRLTEPQVEPREFIITAYRDGGHIGDHIDTFERPERIRILSCVYYFARTPRRFGGGDLRLYGFPKGGGTVQSSSASFVDIEPCTDTLVVFPSWIRHKVTPVRVPSGSWLDSRFTVNCWMHRPSAPRQAAVVGP